MAPVKVSLIELLEHVRIATSSCDVPIDHRDADVEPEMSNHVGESHACKPKAKTGSRQSGGGRGGIPVKKRDVKEVLRAHWKQQHRYRRRRTDLS